MLKVEDLSARGNLFRLPIFHIHAPTRRTSHADAGVITCITTITKQLVNSLFQERGVVQKTVWGKRIADDAAGQRPAAAQKSEHRFSWLLWWARRSERLMLKVEDLSSRGNLFRLSICISTRPLAKPQTPMQVLSPASQPLQSSQLIRCSRKWGYPKKGYEANV